MHTEGQIRAALKPLVELYGELNTSEIKRRIEDVLELDDEDKIMSETRSEIKLLQRIGNIVAHQRNTVQIYSEGFIVDKSSRPARFIGIEGLSGKETQITNDEIKKRRTKAENNEKKSRIYKK